MSGMAIRIENIGKKYLIRHKAADGRASTEDFWALRDISLDIAKGERVGIIGPNGAGKSTLLKILSRITEPSTGRITLRGSVSSLLEVGTGFHPELTGRENIFLNGAVLGMRRAEIRQKFDEIVAFAEVEKFLDTPVKHYSSGMYVRLAFAVAAHLEPDILVVDEVLAVGDISFQRKCLGKMRDVGTEGRTVLFVSHNLTAVRALCNRAILLEGGAMVFDGDAPEATGRYLAVSTDNLLVRDWGDVSEAPSNHSATLEQVAIRNDAGAIPAGIYTDASFNVEIRFRVKEDDASVGLTINFFDKEGDSVFNTINNLESDWYGKPMPRGVYRSVCRIPANLLNNGRFSIGVNLFGRSFSDACVTTDVLRFEVLDGPSIRGDYFNEFSGVVRPLLPWKTQRTDVS